MQGSLCASGSPTAGREAATGILTVPVAFLQSSSAVYTARASQPQQGHSRVWNSPPLSADQALIPTREDYQRTQDSGIQQRGVGLHPVIQAVPPHMIAFVPPHEDVFPPPQAPQQESSASSAGAIPRTSSENAQNSGVSRRGEEVPQNCRISTQFSGSKVEEAPVLEHFGEDSKENTHLDREHLWGALPTHSSGSRQSIPPDSPRHHTEGPVVPLPSHSEVTFPQDSSSTSEPDATSSLGTAVGSCQMYVASPDASPPLMGSCLTPPSSSDIAAPLSVSCCVPTSPAAPLKLVATDVTLSSKSQMEGTLSAYPAVEAAPLVAAASSDCQEVKSVSTSLSSPTSHVLSPAAPALRAEANSIGDSSHTFGGEEGSTVGALSSSSSQENAGGCFSAADRKSDEQVAGVSPSPPPSAVSAASPCAPVGKSPSVGVPFSNGYVNQDVCFDPPVCPALGIVTLSPGAAPTSEGRVLSASCLGVTESPVSCCVSAVEREGRQSSSSPYHRSSSSESSSADGVAHSSSSLPARCSNGVETEHPPDLPSTTAAGARGSPSRPNAKPSPTGVGDPAATFSSCSGSFLGTETSSCPFPANLSAPPSCSQPVPEEANRTSPPDAVPEDGDTCSPFISSSRSDRPSVLGASPTPSADTALPSPRALCVPVRGGDVGREPSQSHVTPVTGPPSDGACSSSGVFPSSQAVSPASACPPLDAAATPSSQVALVSATESHRLPFDEAVVVKCSPRVASPSRGPDIEAVPLSPVSLAAPSESPALSSVTACGSPPDISLHSSLRASPALVTSSSRCLGVAATPESPSNAPGPSSSSMAPLSLRDVISSTPRSSSPSSPARTASDPVRPRGPRDVCGSTVFTAASPADLSPESGESSPCRGFSELQDVSFLCRSLNGSSSPAFSELQHSSVGIRKAASPPPPTSVALSPNTCVRCLQEYFLSTFPHRRFETASAAAVHKARVKCFAMLKAIKRHASSWASDELVPTAFHGIMTPYSYHVSRVFCCPPVDLNNYFNIFRRWLLKARFEKRFAQQRGEAVRASVGALEERSVSASREDGSVGVPKDPVSAAQGRTREGEVEGLSTERTPVSNFLGGPLLEKLQLTGSSKASIHTTSVTGTQTSAPHMTRGPRTDVGVSEKSENLLGDDVCHVESQVGHPQPDSSRPSSRADSRGDSAWSCPDTEQADPTCSLSLWLLSRLNEAELPHPPFVRDEETGESHRQSQENSEMEATPRSTTESLSSVAMKAVRSHPCLPVSDKTPHRRTSFSGADPLPHEVFGPVDLDREAGSALEEDGCSTSGLDSVLGSAESQTKKDDCWISRSNAGTRRFVECEEGDDEGEIDEWAVLPPLQSKAGKYGSQWRERRQGIFERPTRLGDLSVEELRATITRFVKKQAPRQSCPPSLQRVRKIHDALVAFLEKHDEANFPPLCPGVVPYDSSASGQPFRQRRESGAMGSLLNVSSFPGPRSLGALSLDPEAVHPATVDVGTLRDFVRNSKLKQSLQDVKMTSEPAGGPLMLETHGRSLLSSQFDNPCKHIPSLHFSGYVRNAPGTRSPSGSKKKRTRLDLASLLEETDTTAESEGSLYGGTEDSDELEREKGSRGLQEKKRHEACVATEPAWRDQSVEELLDDLDELRNEAETTSYLSSSADFMSYSKTCAIPCSPRKRLLLAPLFQGGSPTGSIVRLCLSDQYAHPVVKHAVCSRVPAATLSVTGPRGFRPFLLAASPSASRCSSVPVDAPHCGLLSEADIVRACGLDDRNAVFPFSAPILGEVEVAAAPPQQDLPVDPLDENKTRLRSGHTFRRLPKSAGGGSRKGTAGPESRTGRGAAPRLPSQAVIELLSGAAEAPPRKTRRVFFQRHEPVPLPGESLRSAEEYAPPTAPRCGGEWSERSPCRSAALARETTLRCGGSPGRASPDAPEGRPVRTELVTRTFSGSYTITTRHRRRAVDTSQHSATSPATPQQVAGRVAPGEPRGTSERPGRELSETGERAQEEKHWGGAASTSVRGPTKKEKAKVNQSEGCTSASSRSLSPGSRDGSNPASKVR
ncbi:hypothetical protein CSUI_003420 [Cystoisospora suis]|uniref:Uncharacterized protein n=1 Tax=Cystoisospora suis TaxID=483139 RepID=A0A2C6L5L6_9APIC|nr:hypothetical protein CSUI_003420 [Cystoisospora suis]